MTGISRSTVIYSWVWVLIFAVTLAWPYTFDSTIPFPGLAKLAQSPYLALMSTALFICALFVSIPRLQSRNKNIAFAGVVGCLAVAGFLFLSVPFGLANAPLCYEAIRSTKPKAPDR